MVLERFQATTSVARAVYGDGTPQLHTLLEAAKVARAATAGHPHFNFMRHVEPAVDGTLAAMKADLELGLVGSIEGRAVGEVLADLLGLAKEKLAEGGEASKNVAAVLAAAAFEDTTRRLAAAKAGVHDRRDLANVLNALKDAKVLVGSQVSISQSYLSFRNNSLHADWAKVDGAGVASCLAFVEGLILQHFG
jgi:hypothetical protein